MKTSFKLKGLSFKYEEEVSVEIAELETSFEGEISDVTKQMKASMEMLKDAIKIQMGNFDEDEDFDTTYNDDMAEDMELLRKELEM